MLYKNDIEIYGVVLYIMYLSLFTCFLSLETDICKGYRMNILTNNRSFRLEGELIFFFSRFSALDLKMMGRAERQSLFL